MPEPTAHPTNRSISVAGISFDGLFVLTSLWFLAGIFLDARSHTHGAPETFFTLEHAIFYAAFVGLAGLLGMTMYRNRAERTSWWEALPDGYDLSVIGLVLFGLGGVGDLLWHEVFGIEANIEALLSPTHLALMAGAVLFASGPLRAAWRRPENEYRSWVARLPMVGSAAVTLSILTFATM